MSQETKPKKPPVADRKMFERSDSARLSVDWRYRTLDSLQDVVRPGYFNDMARDWGLRPWDVIRVTYNATSPAEAGEARVRVDHVHRPDDVTVVLLERKEHGPPVRHDGGMVEEAA